MLSNTTKQTTLALTFDIHTKKQTQQPTTNPLTNMKIHYNQYERKLTQKQIQIQKRKQSLIHFMHQCTDIHTTQNKALCTYHKHIQYNTKHTHTHRIKKYAHIFLTHFCAIR